MKKLLVVLGLLGVTSLLADYQLTLIDKDGNQTDECVKSYSFSNNLESIARSKGVLKDVYSDKEVMTNKVYFGKPVYRRVFKFDDYVVPIGKAGVYKYTDVISENIDKVVNLDFKIYRENFLHSGNNSMYAIYASGVTSYVGASYDKVSKKANIYLRNSITGSTPWNISDPSITVEYTKTTDTAGSSSDTFKSYLHYTSSSSTTNELISVDLKETGVRILEDYTYDSSTNSCTKN